ncbi:MAG: hypothetical protein WCX12_03950, partial [Candidatus Paceibacterota bacterium]
MSNFNPFKNTELVTKPSVDQNETEKTEAKKSNLFKRVGVFASAAAMLLSVEAGSALAQGKEKSPELKGRDKYEMIIKNNVKLEGEISKIVEQRGKAGRMNQMPIKKLDIPDCGSIIIGYNTEGRP